MEEKRSFDAASDAMQAGDHKREPKYTQKALEEKLHRLIGQRRAKMAQITAKVKEIDRMKNNEEHVDKVESETCQSFYKLHEEFVLLNNNVAQMLPEDEANTDQCNWYESKAATIKQFLQETESWIQERKRHVLNEEEVTPHDSVSVIADLRRQRGTSRSSSSTESSSVLSNTSSVVRMKEEAKRAALLAQAELLKKKKVIQLQEAKLKTELEELEIETAIAASTAKLKVFQNHEDPRDAMNKYVKYRLEEPLSSLPRSHPVQLHAPMIANDEEKEDHPISNVSASITKYSSHAYLCQQHHSDGAPPTGPYEPTSKAEKGSAAWSVDFENPDDCALKGSSVEFRCSYSYPDHELVRETAWYKGTLQNSIWKRVKLSVLPSYKSRFEYQGDHARNCNLVLHDLQEDDTGNYYFWFDTNQFGRHSKQSVFLSVTEVKANIQPRRVTSGDRVTLECQTKCPNPRITWFKDGRTVTETHFQAQPYDTGNYSCCVEGLNSAQSDPVALDVWYPPLNVSVETNLSSPLLVGSSVSLACRGFANPAADVYTWWFSSTASNRSSELQVGSGQVLSISCVTLTHTGWYICQAKNSLGQSQSAEVLLTVEEPVHPFIVLGIGIKVIILLMLPLVIIWVWKRRCQSVVDKENTSNDYGNVMFG